MVDSPVYYSPGEQRREGMSGCTIALLGCGAVALLLVIAIGIGIWYVASNFREIASNLAETVVVESVKESKLPQDQKDRIIARVSQVKEDFQAGKISDEQVEQVFENLAASPLLPLGAVEFYEEHYIKPSELSDEEKTAAVRTLERFARGVYEEKIPRGAIDEVTAPISEKNAKGEQELKDKPTADELRSMLKLAKERADNAKIPDEPFEVNIADELDRAIDAGLAVRSLAKKKRPAEEELPAEDPSGEGT